MELNPSISELLFDGTVIPAHPLALTKERTLDEESQRLLTRYYIASGAGGIAVGVHTTQFEIRSPKVNLFEKVLTLAAAEVQQSGRSRPFIKVAGICGPTEQAVREARFARSLGYDLGLLSISGLSDWTESELLARAEKVGNEIPIFGFYLQAAVGGKVLSTEYWQKFAEIPAVKAIKIAPFNRYQTLDVIQGLCNSSRHRDVALYTGNDDNIFVDLLSTYEFNTPGGIVRKEIVGGLLGHWAVWTSRAVEHLEAIKKAKKSGIGGVAALLMQANQVTDANAVFFDARNNFKGCIAGIHEVLRMQGLMRGIWCLDPEEGLSPGQFEEIDRVYRDYKNLNDDEFVNQFLRESREQRLVRNITRMRVR